MPARVIHSFDLQPTISPEGAERERGKKSVRKRERKRLLTSECDKEKRRS